MYAGHHQKRVTVPGSLHGTLNQTEKSVFYAVALAFQSNSEFYLTTEDTLFGDFDDIIIVTSTGRVSAIQFKHKRDIAEASPISINEALVEAKGDYTFFEYYRSIENSNPNWANDAGLELELHTNRPADSQFAFIFDNNTKKIKTEFFDVNTTKKHFSLMREIVITSILKGNNKLLNSKPPLESYLDYLNDLLSVLEDNNPQSPQINFLDKTFENLYKVFKPSVVKRAKPQQKINIIKVALQNIYANKELFTNYWSKLRNFLNKNLLPYSTISHQDIINASIHLERHRILSYS